MQKQFIAILVSLLFCATCFVSANPVASIEGLSNPFKHPNPLCIPVLCYAPCMCGSQLNARGCETCSCLPCDGSNWQL